MSCTRLKKKNGLEIAVKKEKKNIMASQVTCASLTLRQYQYICFFVIFLTSEYICKKLV
jgi:hypothetical protein